MRSHDSPAGGERRARGGGGEKKQPGWLSKPSAEGPGYVLLQPVCVKVNTAESVAACDTITPSFVNSARLEGVKREVGTQKSEKYT